MKDNISAKLLIQGGAHAYFNEIERSHQSPIFYIMKSQNIVILEAINSRDPDCIHRVKNSDDASLI
jgi:hypothetical protein